VKGCRIAAVAALILTAARGAVAAEVPSAMEPISGIDTSTAQETATKNVLALNSSMFELYDNSLHIFQNNILAKHPVILGLFSGAGGRFILYRPGMAPLEAPSVPIVYQLLKSVGHSTMALSEVIIPYLENPDNLAWRGPLLAYRSRMQSALDGIDVTAMPEDWRASSRAILQNNIAFMDGCAEKGAISSSDLQAFANRQAPLLKKNIAWAAQTQVAHWMQVIATGSRCWGATGKRPMPPATRSMSPDRTTCCSACWHSSSVRKRSMIVWY
jgi:hypothetical protein